MGSKLDSLAELAGYDDAMMMLEEGSCDGMCWGICTNPGCECIEEVEPDCRDGWCEDCKTNTVRSALDLAGMI